MAARGQDRQLGKQSRRGRRTQRMTRRDTQIERHARLYKHTDTHTHAHSSKRSKRESETNTARDDDTQVWTHARTHLHLSSISLLMTNYPRREGCWCYTSPWQEQLAVGGSSTALQRVTNATEDSGVSRMAMWERPTPNMCLSAVNKSSLTIILEEILWLCD